MPDPTKPGARPSDEAIEEGAGVTEAAKNEQQRIDQIAMKMAKRAQKRIHEDEETTPGNKIFSK